MKTHSDRVHTYRIPSVNTYGGYMGDFPGDLSIEK
jgi:hypothetical protein